MRIRELKAVHYRNFPELELRDLRQKILIYGKNGSGKSNFLELLYFSYVYRSFKNHREIHLCEYNENFFSVKLSDQSGEKKIIYFRDKGKKIFLNEEKQNPIPRFIPFLSSKIMIQFTSSLDFRRSFLDYLISSVDEEYKANLKQYFFILKEKKVIAARSFTRNNADKKFDINSVRNGFEMLNESLGKILVKIVKKRELYINLINGFMKEFQTFWNYDLHYGTDYLKYDESELLYILNSAFEKEIYSKRYSGCHNDQFTLRKDGELIENEGSFADYKLFFALLNIACSYLVERVTGEFPIFLSDDYFYEIDDQNRKIFFEILKNTVLMNMQCFFTLSSPKNLPEINFETVYKIEDNNFYLVDLY